MRIQTALGTAVCADWTRRDALQACLAAGLSFTLPGLDLRAAERRGTERQKSLITLWLDGGPSQLETWDPHPGTEIGGETEAIDTSLPGVQIAADYPRTAEQLSHLSVVRSLVSKEGDHERAAYMLKTGYRPEPTIVHPSLAAILSHERPDEQVEIPMSVAIGETQHYPRGGFLGDQYDAFRIFSPGQAIQNLQAVVDEKRQSRRVESLNRVSDNFRSGRRIRVEKTLADRNLNAALKMMTSEQLKAFEYDGEPQAVRDAYGDNSFGRGCLIARRLVDVGVRSVEVSMGTFDGHVNNFETHKARAKELDPALAALVKDLQERDLWQSTLLLVIGEFGRTPKINGLAGRDHWPTGFSCLIGGAGLRSGVVIGATDPTGEKVNPEDPVEVKDLFATIFERLGVDFHKEVITPIGRPIRYCEGEPVARLLPG